MKLLILLVLLSTIVRADVIAIPSGGSGGGGGSGVTTMTAVGSSPNDNAASISGSNLTMQPADATHPGVVANAVQVFPPGLKTFSDNVLVTGTSVQILSETSVFKIDRPGTPDTGANPRMQFRTDTAFGFDIYQDTSVTGDTLFKRVSSGVGTTVMEFKRDTAGIFLSEYISCVALTTNGSGLIGCTASDERLKKDIVPYERGLEAIAGLTPKSFKFKDPGDKDIEHSALIAQNVARFIPEAVRVGPQGDMQVDYWTIIATQANAINELRARLERLESHDVTKAKWIKKAIPMRPIYQAKPGAKPSKVKYVNGHWK